MVVKTMTTYEAITKSGTYASGHEELLALADSILAKHEKLLAAWLTECSVPGQAAVLGILMVSTHRVMFISEQLVVMRYADCIGIGCTPEDRMLLTSNGQQLIIHSSKRMAKEIRATLLDAIETFPAQKEIEF